MHCPSCYTRLEITERAGIEIDYCPSCRGIWLDRGELDKILERSSVAAVSHAPSAPPRHREYEEKPRRKKKKRTEWLEDILDIFD